MSSVEAHTHETERINPIKKYLSTQKIYCVLKLSKIVQLLIFFWRNMGRDSIKKKKMFYPKGEKRWESLGRNKSCFTIHVQVQKI